LITSGSLLTAFPRRRLTLLPVVSVRCMARATLKPIDRPSAVRTVPLASKCVSSMLCRVSLRVYSRPNCGWADTPAAGRASEVAAIAAPSTASADDDITRTGRPVSISTMDLISAIRGSASVSSLLAGATADGAA
jgi:hypothetical protein